VDTGAKREKKRTRVEERGKDRTSRKGISKIKYRWDLKLREGLRNLFHVSITLPDFVRSLRSLDLDDCKQRWRERRVPRDKEEDS